MKVHDEEYLKKLMQKGTIDSLLDFTVFMENSAYIAPRQGDGGKLRVWLDFLNYTGCYCEIDVEIKKEAEESLIYLSDCPAIKFFNIEDEKFDSLADLEENILVDVFGAKLLNYGGYEPEYLFFNLLSEEFSEELYKQYLADLENGVLFLHKEGEILGRFLIVEYKDGLVKIIG